MELLNVEIKARCPKPDAARAVLKALKADFKGVDNQLDTYFKVANGRLKLREGNIENSLIHYRRPDGGKPKASDVCLVAQPPDGGMKTLLARALGVLAEVRKRREIYFVGNVKFHIDEVPGLGNFVEIEVIDQTGKANQGELRQTCRHYMELLGIATADLVACSYSDMVLAEAAATHGKGDAVDRRDRLVSRPFSYKLTKNGKLMVYRDGKCVKTFKGGLCEDFAAFSQTAGEEEMQLRLAKLTGHYKHGNE